MVIVQGGDLRQILPVVEGGTRSQVVTMMFSLLSTLRPRDIHNRVSRKWEYRGSSDDGTIQHLDLVLVDQEANVIYAEIPSSQIETHGSLLQQDGIYVIDRFRIFNAKTYYNPVDTMYMLQFTCHTRIHPAKDPPATFPTYVYRLTHFTDLKEYADVIGIITEVSEPEWTHLSNQSRPILCRNIIIKDDSESQCRITLWGQRAIEFNVEPVCNSTAPTPVIILFVGCLVKTFQGQIYLSGNAACHWYFNPTIPETTFLHNKFQNQHIHINRVGTALQELSQPQPEPTPKSMTLKEMQDIDPYEFPETGIHFTVTVTHILDQFPWWFRSCNLCSKACKPYDTHYKCYPCDSTNYRYKDDQDTQTHSAARKRLYTEKETFSEKKSAATTSPSHDLEQPSDAAKSNKQLHISVKSPKYHQTK